MAGFNPNKDRKVIPRWRRFATTLRLGELASASIPRENVDGDVTGDFLTPKFEAWKTSGDDVHAADFVGAGVALRKEQQVADAARFLLRKHSNVPPLVRDLAKVAVARSDNTTSDMTAVQSEEGRDAQIALLKAIRKRLQYEPRDAVSWVELSLSYSVLGQHEKARRMMKVAIHLAGENRFVLRSASRLWVHLNDLGEAHQIIRRARSTRYDPWLLAAEIATAGAARQPPKYVREARRMLNSRLFSPKHLSELASALATLELESGRVQRAKKLFRQSLESATENSIAQAAWIAQKDNAISLDDSLLDMSNAFEARYWTHYRRQQWEKSVTDCWRWQFDQPFSSRPSMHGSYVTAIVLEQYDESEKFAARGIVANPNDFTLLNNLSFAQINLGKLSEARGNIERAGRLGGGGMREESVLLATNAFLAFREGDGDRGRYLYEDALQKARHLDDSRLYAVASAYYALEAIRAEISDAASIIDRSLDAIKRVQDPSVVSLESKLHTVALRRA